MWDKHFKIRKWPLIGLALVLCYFVLNEHTPNESLKNVIRSDGRGYYAYLPAYFLFNDPSFNKSTRSEKQETGAKDQFYLVKDDNGKLHNKYFPGLAILQMPFFGLACATSFICGKSLNGYSELFQFYFLLGSLLYTLFGLLLFYNCLKILFPSDEKKISWFIAAIYLSTPLWFYSILKPSFSHHYSFFLFGLFAFLTLKVKDKPSYLSLLFLGMVVGLIALVRPTNLVVVILIPFLLGSHKECVAIWKELSSDSGRKLNTILIGFLVVFFFLILIWRWQSGRWFFWPYIGEGFNWFKPHFWQNLFSFRIGLFVHTPILLLTIWGTYFLYKENKFQFIFWWIYFILNIYTISAWWCWDYESSFGNRPTTEHLFFLVLPIFHTIQKLPKLMWSLILVFSLVNLYRFDQYTTGIFPNQRFTAESYFKSLQFWKKYPEYRFNFTRSPETYGNKLEEKVLLDFQDEKTIHANNEFPLGGETLLHQPRTSERYYYRVEFDKKIRTNKFEGVYLVVDAYNDDKSKRHYLSIDLFNDRQEGRNNWENLIFEGTIIDNLQEYTYLKIYFWNHKQKEFSVKDVTISLSTYKAE